MRQRKSSIRLFAKPIIDIKLVDPPAAHKKPTTLFSQESPVNSIRFFSAAEASKLYIGVAVITTRASEITFEIGAIDG
jgi:hypothetical protein